MSTIRDIFLLVILLGVLLVAIVFNGLWNMVVNLRFAIHPQLQKCGNSLGNTFLDMLTDMRFRARQAFPRILVVCLIPGQVLTRKRKRLSAAEHTMQALFVGRGQCKIGNHQVSLLVDVNDLELARKYGELVGRQHGVKIAVSCNSVDCANLR